MSALVVVLIFVGICYAIYRLFSRSREEMVCQDCGTVTQGATTTRGSLAIEIILWLCFLVPGLIYSIWRLTTRRHDACPQCSGRMIPVSTPRGRELAARYKPVQDF